MIICVEGASVRWLGLQIGRQTDSKSNGRTIDRTNERMDERTTDRTSFVFTEDGANVGEWCRAWCSLRVRGFLCWEGRIPFSAERRKQLSPMRCRRGDGEQSADGSKQVDLKINAYDRRDSTAAASAVDALAVEVMFRFEL